MRQSETKNSKFLKTLKFNIESNGLNEYGAFLPRDIFVAVFDVLLKKRRTKFKYKCAHSQ